MWKNGIALRFELYGCQITGKTDEVYFTVQLLWLFLANLVMGLTPVKTWQRVLPSFIPVILRWVRAKWSPLEYIFWKRTRHNRQMWKNSLFFSLHLCNLNNSVICPSINPSKASIHTFLSFLSSTAHNTPTLMCSQTLAPALSYAYPPSLSPTHTLHTLTAHSHTHTHTHTKKETHSVLIE